MRERPFRGEIQGRRSIRLKGFNYTKHGTYFVTICTIDRQHVFGEISDGQMILNEDGYTADHYWREIPDHFSNVSLGEFIIMPDHIHGIITITPTDASDDDVGARHCLAPVCLAPVDADAENMGARRCLAPTISPTEWQCLASKNISRFQHPAPRSLSSIIGSFESIVSKHINGESGIRGESIWQQNFYEKIVTTQDDLYDAREYIRTNPQNWRQNTLPISPSSKILSHPIS
jgi:putative transposase